MQKCKRERHTSLVIPLVVDHLDAPESDMECGDKPDETPCPTVEPDKLVEMELQREGVCEDGKWRLLEAEKDA